MLPPDLGAGALGEVKAATVAMWLTAVVIAEFPASGSEVDFFVMVSVLPVGAVMPLHPSLGAADES
jgi:hypothetical protein